MARILAVEDSAEAQMLIRRALRDRYDLAFAESAADARRQSAAQPPDLFLLDAGLPDTDGFELCAQLKSDPVLDSIPIVFLTGRGETADKVTAFRLGAEDYVEKPFVAEELLARIEARLRHPVKDHERLCFEDLELDAVRQEVLLRDEQREWTCDLTPHEFRILHCLAASRGLPVARDRLMESAWAGVKVAERTVDTHVSNLRKKLEGHGELVEAVRGVGYRLAPIRGD